MSAAPHRRSTGTVRPRGGPRRAKRRHLGRRLRAGAAAISAVVAAAAIPASAPADWSMPQSVSGPQASEVVSLAYDRAGNGLLIWSGQPGPFYDSAVRPAGETTWRDGPRLPARLAYLHAKPAISLYGRTRALLVASRRGGSADALRYAIVTAVGRSNGTFPAPRQLDAGAIVGRKAPRSLGTPSLAVMSTGAAVAAWSRSDGRATVIRLSERLAGAAFRRPRTISPAGARTPVVAIAANGDRIVAWYRAGRIEARVRRAGAAWGPIRLAGRAAHTPSALRAAMSPDGSVLLAWSTLHYREGGPSRLTFDAATLRPGGSWTTHRLDRYDAHGVRFSQAELRLDARFDATGRGVVAWQSTATTPEVAAVKVVRVPATGIEAPRIVAEDVRLTGAAVGPNGDLALAWERETGDDTLRTRIIVGVGSPGGVLAHETLPVECPTPSLCLPLGGRPAFDPVTGALTVAWLQRDDAAWRVYVATRPAP